MLFYAVHYKTHCPFITHSSTMITVVTTVVFLMLVAHSALLFCLRVYYDVFHADIFR